MNGDNMFSPSGNLLREEDKYDPDGVEIHVPMETPQRRTVKEFFIKYFLHGKIVKVITF